METSATPSAAFHSPLVGLDTYTETPGICIFCISLSTIGRKVESNEPADGEPEDADGEPPDVVLLQPAAARTRAAPTTNVPEMFPAALLTFRTYPSRGTHSPQAGSVTAGRGTNQIDVAVSDGWRDWSQGEH